MGEGLEEEQAMACGGVLIIVFCFLFLFNYGMNYKLYLVDIEMTRVNYLARCKSVIDKKLKK
jgi:hypothetical protein